MILTIDTENESVQSLKRAVAVLEEVITSRSPQEPLQGVRAVEQAMQEIPAVVHGTKPKEEKAPFASGIQVYE